MNHDNYPHAREQEKKGVHTSKCILDMSLAVSIDIRGERDWKR